MPAWWVFHGDNFEDERAGGFLWAPTHDAAGRRPDHWRRLEEARAGDVVFSCRGRVLTHAMAVTADGRRSPWPYARARPADVHGEGIRVDGEFLELPTPRVAVDRFPRDGVLHLFNADEGPLDHRGAGKQGYYFRLPPAAEAYLYERGVRRSTDALDALRRGSIRQVIMAGCIGFVDESGNAG